MEDDISRARRGKWVYSFRHGMSENYGTHLHMCTEIIYIMQGNVSYNVEGVTYSLSPGDLIFTTPNEFHSFCFPTPCRYYRQFMHIYPQFVESVAERLPDLSAKQPGEGNFIPSAAVNKYRVYEIFERMQAVCRRNPEHIDAFMLAYSIEMLTVIAEILKNEDIKKSQPETNKNVDRLMKYVDDNYTENITVQSVSNYMFLDPTYVSRLFKQYTGMTLKPYINMKRVALAKKLILSGRPATNVYMECGFGNYTTFYRVFKKYVGCPPEDIKRRAPR